MTGTCLRKSYKKLMATKNDDHITSGCVLACAKRVDAQRAQAAVLNTLTESKQFHKIKVSDKTKDNKARAPVNWATQWQPCRYCGRIHQLRQCPAYGKMHVECSKVGDFRKVCHSRRTEWSMRWSRRFLRSTEEMRMKE